MCNRYGECNILNRDETLKRFLLHGKKVCESILKNLDKIKQSRYDSYLRLVEEAGEFKRQVINRGKKVETRSKTVNNSQKAKISSKKREETRRKLKQNFDRIKGVQNNIYD